MSLCMGVGLAAACGLRVFLPLVLLSLATKLGVVSPGTGWEWIGSTPAVLGLSLAATLEIAGYWIPWLDHALDTVATPLAIAAGGVAALAATGAVGDMHPMLTHAVALLGGGATAGAVQAASVTTRAASTISTGGLLNPVISTIESIAAAVLGFLAIVVPVLTGLAMIVIALVLIRRWTRRPAPVPALAA